MKARIAALELDQVMAGKFEGLGPRKLAGSLWHGVCDGVGVDAALFGEGDTPAWITGHGLIPSEFARRWIGDPEADMSLRRIFLGPKDHQVVAWESQARYFPANLRRMVILPDDVCRTPFCDAPIKEADHVVPAREGGPTSWENSSGLCAVCSQIKENAGWQHQATSEQLTVTTPTGHQYHKTTGPVLEGLPPDKREPPDESPCDEVHSFDCGNVIDIAWPPAQNVAA